MGAPSFRSFIAEGWDSTNLDRPFSDSAVSSPGVPIPRPGNRQSFSCPLRSITPRRRTMGIEKPRKEIAAGAEVASTFPGPISRESARSAPSPVYHLNNTPTPPLFIFKTLQIISVPPFGWSPTRKPHRYRGWRDAGSPVSIRWILLSLPSIECRTQRKLI